MENFVEPNDTFIFYKDISLKEDEEIQFLDYFDIVLKCHYNLTLNKDKVYLVAKLDEFGSIFYGNYVIEGYLY
jgi:hypothetical protein